MQITFGYVVAVLLLSLLVQEAHECAHMLANDLLHICTNSHRYFLYWQMCDTGSRWKLALLAFAGPTVNFFFMWMGYRLLERRSSPRQKSYGFSYILAAVPLQRLQAIIYRGSDEIFAFKKLLSPGEPFKGAAVLAGAMLIILLAGPPLYRAFTQIKDTKNGMLVLMAGLLLPFIFITLLQQIVFNTARALPASPAGMLWVSSLFLIDLVLLLLFIPFRKSAGSLFS